MAMVKMTSALEANIPKNLNIKNSSNFRDPSFSSYLYGAEETFVLNLHSSNNFNKKADDGEIDIFSAEKYFNEGVDQENTKNVEPQNKYRIDELANVDVLKQKPRPVTPSIHSESSWNSRSALLQNFTRNHQQTKAKSNNKSYGKKILASLGCNCYCKDKESVKVDSGKFHAKPRQNPIKTISSAQSFEFSTTGVNQIQMSQEEETRKSLEVFGSEKKVTVLTTWDAIAPKPEEIDTINIAASCNGEDEYAESDASSDLFEIESFPSTNTANPSLVRQVSDGMSSYAPSEVSIDWSVVTASAADFSVMSESEEFKVPSTKRDQKSKRRSGILLGCKSLKAVGVVGDAHKNSERTSMERHLKTESIMPMTRFHAESRFDAGKRQHDFTTRSFSTSSYSGRPADFLYI